MAELDRFPPDRTDPTHTDPTHTASGARVPPRLRSTGVASFALVMLATVLTACFTASEPRTGEPPNDLESYAPGRSGEVRLVELVLPGETAPTQVTVEVIDGLMIYQGDIVLGEATGAALAPTSVVITETDARWADATVPFVIDASIDAVMQTRIEDAIAHWEANANLAFVERTNETDYVRFRSGDGCSSAVGRQTDEQAIDLRLDTPTRWGCGTGNVIHEIGHAIGLWHEQSREDRDEFIEIVWDDIIEEKEGNFEQHTGDGTDVGPYDFGSVMHYPARAFGIENASGVAAVTIRTKPPGQAIGQRNGLSDLDRAAVRRMYPETALPFVDVTSPGPGFAVDEGVSVSFAADVIADIDTDLEGAMVRWSYLRAGEVVPFFFATEGVGETAERAFCDGLYDVTAEGLNASYQTIAETTLRLTVRDLGMTSPPAMCPISVTITQPVDGGAYAEGATIALTAVIDDDHPETDAPLYPVTWRVNDPEDGTIVGTGLASSTKLGVGQHTVYVRYGSATDAVTIDVVEASLTPPVVSIQSPADGSTFDWSSGNGSTVPVSVSGTATDAEDGALDGASVVWSARRHDLASYAQMGTGTTTTLQFPIVGCTTQYYDLRLQATDADGMIGIDEIEIGIVPPFC
ncbi:MAG: M12 family metallopeptidase [Trueperaceae bacterium]